MNKPFGLGSTTFLLRGGTLCDPASGRSDRSDLLVEDGVVTGIGVDLPSAAHVPVIDVADCLISPGFFDMHVHLREPGQEEKETIETGTRAAASGGFTTVACMPNTEPAIDTLGTLELVLRLAASAGNARVCPIAAITKGRGGESLSEMAELREGGAIGFSDDGSPVVDGRVMRRAMEYAESLDAPIVSHAEDTTLSTNGVMNEGSRSVRMGLVGIPSISEEIGVVRDILLARHTGCRLHVCHVSTAGAVEAIRTARAAGTAVTGEAAPHHFTLTEESVEGYRTDAKMNPPLRTSADRDAIIEGLGDGTLSVIATDHAPHTAEEKEAEFDRAPFGIIGLETALGICVTELVRPGHLTHADLVEKLCVHPRSIVGIGGTRIVQGETADLTVWNPEAVWVVTEGELRSRSRNTPFLGRELSGRSALCVASGKVTDWRDQLAPLA